MSPEHRPLLAVERLGPFARLIRVGNDLDHDAAAELRQLVEGQLELAQTRQCFITDLLIDVSAVGRFVPGVLETLLSTRCRAHERGIAVHLSGCAGRAHRLPRYVREALTAFDPFITATLPEQT